MRSAPAVARSNPRLERTQRNGACARDSYHACASGIRTLASIAFIFAPRRRSESAALSWSAVQWAEIGPTLSVKRISSCTWLRRVRKSRKGFATKLATNHPAPPTAKVARTGQIADHMSVPLFRRQQRHHFVGLDAVDERGQACMIGRRRSSIELR